MRNTFTKNKNIMHFNLLCRPKLLITPIVYNRVVPVETERNMARAFAYFINSSQLDVSVIRECFVLNRFESYIFFSRVVFSLIRFDFSSKFSIRRSR